jgi:hypothetical protein
MGFVVLIVVCLVLLGCVIALVAKDYEGSEWACPHGYDDFGCQPSCPLHRHCWGEDE